MKFAFCVKTPYQLLNCINFVWHDIEGSRGNGDLYMYGIHEKYRRAVSALKEEKLFANIYLCSNDLSKEFPHNILRTKELLFPASVVKKYSDGGIYQRDYYDTIIFSSLSALPTALADLNKKAKLWLYEDGSGSYYGNYFDYFGTWKTRLFYKVFKKGMQGLEPERLYVSNLAMCKNDLHIQLVQLPPISQDPTLVDFLNTVFFSNGKNDLLNRKYIFLSQPFNETTKGKLNMVLDHLKSNYKNRTIVRPHPDERDQEYRGLDVSGNNTMWELFCIESLSDEQVLIAVFSTAQLTPKFLCNKEPNLIFLHHLIPTALGAERIENIDRFLDGLRESYTDKSRISIPRTMQEFAESINQYGSCRDI